MGYLGITFGVILHNYRPDEINLNELNPRTAKSNLKLVLESYKRAGVDLAGIININDMATKEPIQHPFSFLHRDYDLYYLKSLLRIRSILYSLGYNDYI